MRVRGKSTSRADEIVVEHAQRTEMNVPVVVPLVEGKTVPAVEPAVAAATPLFRFLYAQHDLLLFSYILNLKYMGK
jgi:hypothetical protein